MHIASTDLPSDYSNAASSRLAPALASMALGLFIIFMVGFAPIQAIHDAAHDSRHSAAFPCH